MSESDVDVHFGTLASGQGDDDYTDDGKVDRRVSVRGWDRDSEQECRRSPFRAGFAGRVT